MPLPSSLLTGLLEYWPYDELSGSVAHGARGQIDLALASPTTWGVHGLDGLWGTGGGFAGNATGTINAALEGLKNVGDAVTLAIEHWFSGSQTTVDPWPGTTDPTACALGKVTVQSGDFMYVGYGAHLPPAADPVTDTDVYVGSGVGTGNGAWTFIHAPPFQSWAGSSAYVALLQLVRTSSTQITCTLYAQGTQNMNTAVLTASYFAGGIGLLLGTGSDPRPPITLRGAVWLRTLTSDERTAIASTLSGLGDLLDGGSTGLLDGTGAQRFPVMPELIQTSTRTTLATQTFQRHARLVTPRRRRTCRFPIRLHASEIPAMVQVIKDSNYGSLPVKWRHPTDDPAGPLETAGDWIMTNAADAGLTLGRAQAGAAMTIELQLEEV